MSFRVGFQVKTPWIFAPVGGLQCQIFVVRRKWLGFLVRVEVVVGRWRGMCECLDGHGVVELFL